jgi:tripartite-type tricarboxylate transporter receptor subunit TctC
MIFDNMPSALPHIKSGKLRALGVTGPQRSSALPQVPTIAEAGVPGYDSLSWSGIAAPAGTPKETVARLNRAIDAILASAEMRTKLADQGGEAIGGSPERFGAHIRAEREKWGRLIRERNISLN